MFYGYGPDCKQLVIIFSIDLYYDVWTRNKKNMVVLSAQWLGYIGLTNQRNEMKHSCSCMIGQGVESQPIAKKTLNVCLRNFSYKFIIIHLKNNMVQLMQSMNHIANISLGRGLYKKITILKRSI